jgi:hypothetical protein
MLTVTEAKSNTAMSVRPRPFISLERFRGITDRALRRRSENRTRRGRGPEYRSFGSRRSGDETCRVADIPKMEMKCQCARMKRVSKKVAFRRGLPISYMISSSSDPRAVLRAGSPRLSVVCSSGRHRDSATSRLSKGVDTTRTGLTDGDTWPFPIAALLVSTVLRCRKDDMKRQACAFVPFKRHTTGLSGPIIGRSGQRTRVGRDETLTTDVPSPSSLRPA